MTATHQDPLVNLLNQYHGLVRDRVLKDGNVTTALPQSQVKAYLNDKGNVRIEVGSEPYACNALLIGETAWTIRRTQRNDAGAAKLLGDAILAETP